MQRKLWLLFLLALCMSGIGIAFGQKDNGVVNGYKVTYQDGTTSEHAPKQGEVIVFKQPFVIPSLPTPAAATPADTVQTSVEKSN